MSRSSQNAEDGELASQHDAALEEVHNHIKEAFDILKSETLKLRKERDAFEALAKKLEHVQFSKTLKLNVGGQLFSTSLETMKKDPGSMLHAMFSGRFDTKPGEDGTYFMDRDGTHFRYILNYLRTGRLLLPDDKLVREELLEEAQFYQVQGIIDGLTPPPFEDSTILSVPQRQTLNNWLKGTSTSARSKSSLIYCASRNGWAAANFHSCCDQKRPTVIVVRSTNSYIFGGYTEQQWDASGTFKWDANAFLFSLVRPSSSEPTKIDLIKGKEGSAILCNSSYGAVFGSNTPGGYYDLLIGNAANQSNCCQSGLNNSYRCPPDQNATTFLAGNYSFAANEIEVFVFEK